MRIQGDCAIVLQQVLDAVEARADDAFRRRAAARIAGWSGAREQAAQRRSAASANKGVSGALNPAFVFATLGAKLSQDDIVINEAIRNAPILQAHITRTRPASYVGLAGGGLGFSGGMALGLRLARPDRRIVQVIGDGGFHFSSPDSVYAVAQQYQLPIMTLVLDNGGWQAVKSAVQRVYPRGIAAETDQFQSRLTSGRQGETRDFSAVARAFGAHGERVVEPNELAAAIDRCLAALDDGKAAVLHVHVTRL
jgi:acetolactate synthase-1/2/3 large subunit